MGVIELKVLKSLPKKSNTKIIIPHFTNMQKYFLLKYFGFLFLKITKSKQFFLLNTMTAIKIGNNKNSSTNSYNTEELIKHALYYSEKKINYHDLLRQLRKK